MPIAASEAAGRERLELLLLPLQEQGGADAADARAPDLRASCARATIIGAVCGKELPKFCKMLARFRLFRNRF